MKWLPAYPRRLVKRMIREKREEHKGYRYKIKIDKDTNLILVIDLKEKKKYVFLK